MKTRIITGANKCILFLLAFLLIIPQSCYRKFYKVADNPGSSNIDSTVEAQAQKSKYIILRSGLDAYHMENIVVNPDHKSLTCTLGRISDAHQYYLATDKKKAIPFTSKESAVLNEVHIYTLQNDQF